MNKHQIKDQINGLAMTVENDKPVHVLTDTQLENIYSLLLDVVKSVVPEKGEDGFRLNTFKEGYKCGYNEAIDNIEENIKALE